ncbi:MAG: prepilin-type N-terminal cleavage/methylation domain-containing protein [Candidatus Paceibacterota bacterium]
MFIFLKKEKGFTLVELLVSITILVIVLVGIYSGYNSVLKIMNIIRVKGIMTNIANEQFEIVRNLSYQNVGVVNGIPSGLIPQTKTVERDGKSFIIESIIRNIDEPFDGTFDGTPKDLSPADMKIIELTVSCSSCGASLTPISFTTKVSPKNLETASVNGALVVKVFDASGLPVPEANVNIINNNVIPTINLNDQTDINGVLTIVDAPPSVSGYKIVVTKNGYSTDRTYTIGEGGNQNPSKPDVTVVVQQISQISFTIDKISSINISTINNQCISTPNFNFNMSGHKLIGTDPDKVKYSELLSTNNLGKLDLSNIEWDTYMISGADSVNDIIGTNPLLSLGVNPDVQLSMEIITAPKNGRRLLVVVRDQSTGLPVSDAIVTLTGPNSYSKSVITNEGFLNQTDWSGGGGQASFIEPNMYLDSDGNIDYSSSPGDISLNKIFANYTTSGYLTSSTLDTGTTSNFKQIVWSPMIQPSQTGELSVKFQIATNNDNTTWNYIGPDETPASYYTYTDSNISISHNGKRYLRYRVYLSTLDQSFTPLLSDISLTYNSSCIPPGQVSFSALLEGTYTISIDKTGYQSTSKDVYITDSWSKEEITISQ